MYKLYIAHFVIISLFLLPLFAWYMLSVVGQPLLCRCNMFDMWAGFTQEASNSQKMFDWYTLSHLIFGALYLYATKFVRIKLSLHIKLLMLIMLSMGLEIIEHTDYVMQHFRSTTISTSYYGDTVINSLGDILGATVGFVLALKIRWRLFVLLLVTIELSSLYFIRDSLLLNILSFILPGEWMLMIYGL